ncbi:bifunctional folylpolyglutamate synthase/dihydrofolate synthase [Erythrobacteraceae bacterium E2-1 Yellow Sea]|nr:bifunctional folylpolyglutamate synthase/dihydrofolate synthase [Erythrobacteraceae bacterium E2-1 Yellow Sea]
MKDFGRSDDPRVQAQLDRLAALTVPQGRLGLDTIRALMERLGNPHRKLPPVFHVAGTNGKGSTCAFLRAILEAEGYLVHATTSPHLVRYNERIRLAGELISDAALAALLKEVLDAGEDLAPSFFEVTIAAAFLAFSRTFAQACVVEVGLGGRFDATNILEPDVLAACGIAALGIDHERFLLAPEDGVPEQPLARIAFEKAGIAKPGVPLVSLDYPADAMEEIVSAANRMNAPLMMRGDGWDASVDERLTYRDSKGELTLPLPSLPGPHQPENAALAVALLRHQHKVQVSAQAMVQGITSATWPARLQKLNPGPLIGAREVWLDGGHNPNAAATLARHFSGQNVHLVIGMIAGKDPSGFMETLNDIPASITVVPVPGHDWFDATYFGTDAASAPDTPTALTALPDDGLPVLIAGSLYLAGEVLRLNDELPD